jgi:ATP-dependent DNA helicase RecQ
MNLTSHPPTQLNLAGMTLAAGQITALPPEVRDRLLDYLQRWGTPAERIALVQTLREAHGPLLFLLDYHATACLAAAEPEQALEIIERRQRRSTTIASQVIEAQALLATGHDAHAETVAADISQAYPRHSLAVRAAAQIFTAVGHFDQAHASLRAYLEQRPHDVAAQVTLARLALEAGDQQLARDVEQGLGAGVPVIADDDDLVQLAMLHEAIGNVESAKSVHLELARRKRVQWEQLSAALAPFADLAPGLAADPAELYRHLSGPQSIAVDHDERRRIQLEAARHFGFMRLREGQTEIVASVLRSESVLAVMPTGAGKSLCYQLPALMLPKPTLVISPLIALMKDQVDSLPTVARRQATFVNSTLTDDEIEARLAGVARGDYKLVYAAPERLRQRAFLAALRRAELGLFVVDEAHCVSLWGHDFRPDYLFIQEARHALGNPPALALTATAPPRVRDEIVDYISADPADEQTADRPRVIALDIFRHNLHLSALQFHNEDEKLTALIKFVLETEGSGIIYVNSRHRAEALAVALRGQGVAAEAYHAGMLERSAIQDRFMSDTTRVVVATIAFGMGIDKRDIRFIVHFHPSRSLAAYYQEVGRAGRDGKPSQGVLFYSNNDWSNLRRWAKADEYSADFLERVYAAVAAQLGIHPDAAAPAPDANVAGPVDLRRLLQVLNTDETTARVAVSTLERADLLSRGFDVPQELTLTLPPRIPAAAKANEEFARLLRGLALGPGQSATFKTHDVATFMRWDQHDAESILLEWEAAGYLKVKAGRRAMWIDLAPRPDDLHERLERMLAQSAAVAQRRIDDMVGYATSETCRHGYISAHFGSPPRSRCDVCDICTGVRPQLPQGEVIADGLPEDADVELMIIDSLISLPKPVGRSGLARILAGSLRAPVTPDKARHHGRLKAIGEGGIMEVIDDLLEEGRLRQYERQGYPVLAPTMRGRAEAETWLEEHPDLAELGEAVTLDEPDETTVDATSEGDKYTGLQKAIWLWRRRTAETIGQPPYMILSNELILRIAEARPQSLEELAALPGMGAQRLEHYGPTLLDIIHLNQPEAGDEEKLAAQRATPPRPRVPPPVTVSPQVERRIFLKLQELRQKHALARRERPSALASNTLLKTIAHAAPASEQALVDIAGFRQSGLLELTPAILAVIAAAHTN